MWTQTKHNKKLLRYSILAGGLALLQACSDNNSLDQDLSSGSNLTTPPSTLSSDVGDVLIGITDAPGDFIHYNVSVTSFKLEQANGVVVETLPQTTDIDFAQYVDLTEFLTIATVPRGNYVKGTLSLDYTSADIVVENVEGVGVSVSADSIVDETGEPVSKLDVDVFLDNANRLIVAPGVPAHLTLDFDLQASNTVELNSSDGIQVIVEPVLLAELSRDKQKQHRARGAINKVDTNTNSYTVFLRPGILPLNRDTQLRALTINTNEETHFEVNGEVIIGDSGINALASLEPYTPSIAFGQYKRNPIRFVASEVYAGTSVPAGDQDVVTGVITSRNDDLITLRGVSINNNQRSATFNDTVTLRLSDSTIFTKQASQDAVGPADISVGQRLRAIGVIETDIDNNTVLNAEQGRVRLLLTTVAGAVVEDSNFLNVDLSSIVGREPEQFNFEGTGVSSEFDASPDTYEIDKVSLFSNGLNQGNLIRVTGHVNAFGMAPADFNAKTIVDLSALPATMRIAWDEPSMTSIDTSDPRSLQIDLTGVARFHHISQGGAKLDLLNQVLRTIVKLPEDNSALFTIVDNGSRTVHTDADLFIADLDTRVAEGALPYGLQAHGEYENANNILSARRVLVKLR